MEDSLKSCPFCGYKDNKVIHEKNQYEIECRCFVLMSDLNKDDLIKRWNRRHNKWKGSLDNYYSIKF